MNSPHKSSTDSYHILSRLQILAAFGCLLIFLYSLHFWKSGDVLRILGVGILVAGAALSSGLLLGFIFGIPRVASEEPTAKAAAESDGTRRESSDAQSSNVTPNSNLVEISDWLTKIMVGVGLVELNSIPAKLGKLSYYVGLGLRPSLYDGRFPCADLLSSGQAAGLAIILLYFALGFLWCYVWTRLYFFNDLRGTVENLRDDRVTDLTLLAEAYINLGQLDEAMHCVDEALESNPRDGRAILTKARILKRLAMNVEAPGVEKVETPEAKKLVTQALALIDQAITLLPGKAEPIYNKACYQALLGFDKNEVLVSLKIAFGLSPAMRDIAADDSDLASLRQDSDFIGLVGANRPGNP
jgi:hypothetical protein